MKALVFLAAGVVEFQDVPEPKVAEGETLITVRASSICGSELHGFKSVGFRVPPLIMGHEFAGTTPDGRRVVVNPLLSCGHCDLCLRGLPELCRERALIGVNRDGGFAERVSVPNSALLDLPDSVDWASAALIEPLANAVHAWSLIGDDAKRDDAKSDGSKSDGAKHGAALRVGVIGAGPIGLVCALVAASHGAEVVIADPSPDRRASAERLGLSAVEALDGEFDGVMDAVGLPATRRDSVERIRPGGTAVWIGLAVDEVELGGNAMVRFEKRIAGSFAYSPAEFDAAVALAPTLDLSWGTRVPLSAAQETFYALAGGDRSIVKAVIVPDGEE